MKKIGALLLICFTITGTFPVSGATSQPKIEDCVICGHACCCPEMCKPLIKKMKAEAASHCGAKKPSTKIQSCDQPNSICRIQNAPPVGMLNLKNESVYANPRLTILGDANPTAGASQERVRETAIRLDFSVPRDTPTPPPKTIA